MAGDTLSRDVALNVIGKIEGYQKELEKVPGVTQKAASRAALQMQKHFTKDLVDQFKKAEKEAARSAGQWRDVFTNTLGSIGADFGKTLAGSVAGMKSEIAGITGEMATFSRATGLSMETVNALRFAMESNGRTFSELSQTLENYPERMEQFRLGSGEGLQVMEALGFKVKDANRLIADMGGTLEEVFRRLQGVENDAHRAALMTSMFGDSALYLSTALADVPLEEWKDRAQIGLDVSERTVKANQDWTATLSVLGEAFTRVKQDATSLVDLTNLAKDVGQAFVVMTAVAVDGVDMLMDQMSLLVTANRAMWNGDLASTQQALEEFWANADRGWTGITKDAIEAGKEFRSVADSIGNTAAESSNLNTKLGKTTQELDKAKQAAKQYDSEIDKLIGKQKSWSQVLFEINEDVLSDEEKIRQASIERMSAVSDAFGEGTASAEAAARANVQIAEREQRDLAALHFEQGMARVEADRETHDIIRSMEAETAEFQKQLFMDRAEIAFEFANIASEAMGGVFDLMMQARQKDLDHAKKTKDKHKDHLNDLVEAQKDAVTKEQAYRIGARIENTRARIAADREAIKDARKAAREVAMMQKGQALFQIGLNTAQAVMMAWGTVPPPLNIAASIAAGAAGATQLAIAAAQPLPKFFGGTARVPGPVPENAGEAVLNRRATDALGPQIIDAINAGLNPLAALAGRFGAPAMAGGGDIYLDGRKVGRVMAANSRRPSGYRSPYGRN